MRWARTLLAAMAASLCACGFRQERATPQQCRTIFDRLVAIELKEMGFNDQALAARWQRELAVGYGEELAECIGKPLSQGAMDCVHGARDAEELSHVCLK